MLITCEHAGRVVPPEYAALFADAGPLLDSHRGWDPGALGVALQLARSLKAPLLAVTTTRLLVEANRSAGHPDLFSRYTRDLDPRERDRIKRVYYLPHRRAVEAWIATRIGNDTESRVLHIGVHSFTDVFDGHTRTVDLGLLFDPARTAESDICEAWRSRLQAECPERVRFNEPYLGTDDGLTTAMRKAFPAGAYAGVEVELRQGLLTTEVGQRAFGNLLARTLLC